MWVTRRHRRAANALVWLDRHLHLGRAGHALWLALWHVVVRRHERLAARAGAGTGAATARASAGE